MNEHRISAASAQPCECHTQVIGFGIAGLGLAVAADQQERLEEFLSRGVVFVDKRTEHQWYSLQYDIASNSKASDFLAGIRRHGLAERILCESVGERVRAHEDGLINLRDVASFFARLAAEFSGQVAEYSQSAVRYEQLVSELRLDDDGMISSLNPARQVIARSRYAVMASGGFEQPLPELQNLAKHLQAGFLCSEDVLRQQSDTLIREQILTGQKILVAGGAHSAFSVLDYLLRHHSTGLQDGQIILLVRNPVRLYHGSVEDCRQYSPLADLSRVDDSSGEVNRYSGLRGDARQVYLNVVSGREPRVSIVNREHFSPQQIGPVGSLIQATGYQARYPAVTDASGGVIELACRHGSLSLTPDFNLQTKGGAALQQLFAMGLGYFNASDQHFTATGEVPVGVNIYHANDASQIFKSIYDARVSAVTAPAYQYAT